MNLRWAVLVTLLNALLLVTTWSVWSAPPSSSPCFTLLAAPSAPTHAEPSATKLEVPLPLTDDLLIVRQC
jgi:hypothetical protein